MKYKYLIHSSGRIYRMNRQTKEFNMLFSFDGTWHDCAIDYTSLQICPHHFRPISPLAVKSFENIGYNQEYFKFTPKQP